MEEPATSKRSKHPARSTRFSSRRESINILLLATLGCRLTGSTRAGCPRRPAPLGYLTPEECARSQSNDIYEVVIERHRRSSTILTSNRHVDEWIPLFDDPILAQSALDRLSHNAYQVQIEGESYRKGQRPDILASNSKMSTNHEKE